ncbi:MAG: GTP cyclohydrolase I FolE [Clostridia bacterium]|jgi:GTP cyclohydrolase I|nr:GTP cyclohydrolase I FolE [Clostridia bacterium]
MVDIKKAEDAVRQLLEAIGEDVTREGLVETPKRVAKMYSEILEGKDEDASEHLSKVFDVKSSDMVIEKDITFYSMCEHHLLPFFGKAHIAYIPSDKVVGLSKLARAVEVYARRLQLQEQMTNEIADAIEECLDAKGVLVVVEAEHTCMTMRGVKKPGSKTVTYAARGEFKENQRLFSDTIALMR